MKLDPDFQGLQEGAIAMWWLQPNPKFSWQLNSETELR